MKKAANTAVVLKFLSTYLLAGVVGHLQVWSANGGWGKSEECITKTKTAPPAAPKVFWTQHKHVPSGVKTLSFDTGILSSVSQSTVKIRTLGRKPYADDVAHVVPSSARSSRAPPYLPDPV